MRIVSIGLILATLWCGNPARADDAATVSAADHRAIEQVIASQLDAFKNDAADRAFSFASPNIQAMFGDAPRFMAMVREAYAPVFRPRSFDFERLVTMDDRIVQRVGLIGPDGKAVLALYTMEREPDGTWRIDGCVLTRPDRLQT